MNNDNKGHAFHLAVIKVKKRRELYDYLKKNLINTQVHYIPIHFHPYYQKKFKFKVGDFPVAEEYYQSGLSLPIYPNLSLEENIFVINKIKNFFDN
jgi:dTDP-4-amino-4,6-dideoxygalactose transaminase